jgi:Domain of unknown function (DUF1996)
MHGRALWLSIAAVLLASAPVTAGALAARAGGRQIAPAKAGRGFFRSHCLYSHTATDDPILMRGMPGMSMVHDFFGNVSTSASSTAASLLAAGKTSCAAPADTSAYWVPALYRDGKRITPVAMSIYYRTAGRNASSIQPLPPGLEMIAGNETAMSPQPTSVAYWNCGATAGVARSALPPAACPAGSQLVLSLVFPDCWDGHTLNGQTQKNVAYAVRRACPTGYPVAIPQLSVHVRYPIATGTGLTLSMGPTANDMPNSIYTAHADVIDAWTPSVLASLVRQCDVSERLCGTVGRDNTPLGVTAAEIAREQRGARRR